MVERVFSTQWKRQKLLSQANTQKLLLPKTLLISPHPSFSYFEERLIYYRLPPFIELEGVYDISGGLVLHLQLQIIFRTNIAFLNIIHPYVLFADTYDS